MTPPARKLPPSTDYRYRRAGRSQACPSRRRRQHPPGDQATPKFITVCPGSSTRFQNPALAWTHRKSPRTRRRQLMSSRRPLDSRRLYRLVSLGCKGRNEFLRSRSSDQKGQHRARRRKRRCLRENARVNSQVHITEWPGRSRSRLRASQEKQC